MPLGCWLDENRAMAAPLCGVQVGLVPLVRCTHKLVAPELDQPPVGNGVVLKLSLVITCCAWLCSEQAVIDSAKQAVRNLVFIFLIRLLVYY